MSGGAPACVLAVVDGSPAGLNAAWRAALVARDRGAPLRLLHASAPARAVQALAEDIRAQLRMEVELCVVEGDALQEAVRSARAAQLLVIGSGRANTLRERIAGTQAERLIRLCRIPVLVVKQTARSGYRRVLVPVDLAPDAGTVIAAATAFSRDPRMEVFHALNTGDEVTLRVPEVPESVQRGLRQRAAARAHAVLEELIAFAGASHAAVTAVAFGHAASLILAKARAMRAELVVIGKRRRGLLADFVLGGVTQRVLAASRADVLVLPAQERTGKALRRQLAFGKA